MKVIRQFMALATLAVSSVPAQDISGNWQGTLRAGPQELRLILQIARTDNGHWKGTMLSIDQSPDRGAGFEASSFSVDGANIRFTVSQIQGRYEGKLSTDGGSITGTWTQILPLPLEFRRATKDTAWSDPSPHRTQFVEVEKNVRLEVLDWGGSGRPLVLLAGLGNSAHIFDKFAPKLTATYHVYGITRRGFGASGAPPPSDEAAYSADRLGDDVLAVVNALKLSRPVHSIAGEELSSVGSRHPEKVAGLIYLDAGYAYAYYDRTRGDFGIDLLELQRKLHPLEPGKSPANRKQLMEDLLATAVPAFERSLKEALKNSEDNPSPQPGAQASAVTLAILRGMRRFTEIRVPVLAIYAAPHATAQRFEDDRARAAADARDEAVVRAQAKALETGCPPLGSFYFRVRATLFFCLMRTMCCAQ